MASIFGKYENLGLIGSGSYGKVYSVRKISNQHIYAIKKLKLSNINNYDRRCILNELKILSSHKCPFLIEYKCAFVEGLYICIVMQYCKNGTLESLIKQNGLNTEKTWKYFSQIVFALNYLHKNQIVYRDLKSSNILIDDNDNIRLIDFGISKILGAYIKYTKTCIGTPYFMSPEVLSNIHYNYKTDIWSLGILLYEMTHGTYPFIAKNMHDLHSKIQHAKFTMNANVDQALQTIIKKCLVSSPYRRISLNALLDVSQIKSNFVTPIDNKMIVFNEIKVPNSTKDWTNSLQKLPCNTTPDPVQTHKAIQRYGFMRNYSRDSLIRLNSALLDQICEKNATILELERQISLIQRT